MPETTIRIVRLPAAERPTKKSRRRPDARARQAKRVEQQKPTKLEMHMFDILRGPAPVWS